ncbi:hypothetical protein E1B28_011873 [Marasmius oreades]|uniref:Uncharacterized protein n=1 Tax=Marasmius oreades TaxID=181124 RepID=A0A9P7RW40_9AGAR|nr:uncharacterized protein E1B28_011873 [Marasmius oreades]KAG7090276.1 hypothetical protein E1B28_011873 [Marasmius oreades]
MQQKSRYHVYGSSSSIPSASLCQTFAHKKLRTNLDDRNKSLGPQEGNFRLGEEPSGKYEGSMDPEELSRRFLSNASTVQPRFGGGVEGGFGGACSGKETGISHGSYKEYATYSAMIDAIELACVELNLRLSKTASSKASSVDWSQDIYPIAHHDLVVDDHESFFHLLCWVALKDAGHGLTDREATETLGEIYDQARYTQGRRVLGGIGKRRAMLSRAMELEGKFAPGPLRDLIVTLENTLLVRYDRAPTEEEVCQYEEFVRSGAESYPRTQEGRMLAKTEEYFQKQKDLCDSSWMLQKFRDAGDSLLKQPSPSFGKEKIRSAEHFKGQVT